MKKKENRLITKKGLDRLKAELDLRKNKLRREIADKLDEAKSIGDLSENSAYHAALEEYQMNEAKIAELRDLIPDLKVAPDKSGDSCVDIGDKVELEDIATGKEVLYTLVGEGEGDPLSNSVSSDSLVGKALIGGKKGDVINIRLPSGTKKYKILDLK